MSGELLDLEQLNREIVEGVVALVHPLKQGITPRLGDYAKRE